MRGTPSKMVLVTLYAVSVPQPPRDATTTKDAHMLRTFLKCSALWTIHRKDCTSYRRIMFNIKKAVGYRKNA
jgi:hypothetical protein